MAQGLIRIDGALDIDPVHPQGGQDGGKDILCTYKGASCVVGVHFRNDSNSARFSEIKKKFKSDLSGVKKNGKRGFLFVTNAHVTDSERNALEAMATAAGVIPCIVYHLERIHAILDCPSGYGLREQYLQIRLTDAERVSYDEERRVQDRAAVKQTIEEALSKYTVDMEAKLKAVLAEVMSAGSGAK